MLQMSLNIDMREPFFTFSNMSSMYFFIKNKDLIDNYYYGLHYKMLLNLDDSPASLNIQRSET